MNRLYVKKPGQIMMHSKGVSLFDWSFGRCGNDEISDDDIAVAVRDYIISKIDRSIQDANLRVATADDRAGAPISISDERAAEMETYLLINRCQGIA